MKIKSIVHSFIGGSFIVGALGLVLTALPLFAGQYFQDFTAFSAGATNFGDGSTLTSTALGTVASVQDTTLKELQLTETGVANTRSAFLLPDLDPGTPVYAFSAKWNSQVYGNFPSAAAGFSFTFGAVRSLSLTNSSYNQESGYGTGLCFSVQTDATNNPGFYLRANGVTIAAQTNNPTIQWGVNGTARHFFEVDWDLVGGLSVSLDGQAIFTNIVTTNYLSLAGDSFVWAARGGANSEEVRLDNLVVLTGGKLVAASVGAPYYFANAYSGYPATNAFDGNPATAWVDNLAAATSIGGTLTSTQTVSAYILNNGSLPASIPLVMPNGAVPPLLWQLQGSADGVNWTGFGNTTVHFVNNQERRAFLVAGSQPYPDWRLNIQFNAALNNAGFGTGLGELQLYTLQPTIYAAPVLTGSGAASVVLPQIAFTANIDTRGLNSTVVMEVGTNTSYGTSATNVIAGSVAGAAAFAGVVPMSSFDRVTPLHGRIRVSNALGSVTGPDLVFNSQSFELRASGRLNNFGDSGGFGPWGDSILWLDADNDGNLDLAVLGPSLSNPGIADAAMLFNPNTNGVGHWHYVKMPTITSYQGFLAAGDFNNDNLPDLVSAGADLRFDIVGGATAQPAVWFGASQRQNFGQIVYHLQDPALNYASPFGQARGVVRDFDHDGKQDLFMTGTTEDINGQVIASFSRMYRNVLTGPAGIHATNLVFCNTSIPPMGWVADVLYGYGSYSVSSGYLNADGFSDLYTYGDYNVSNPGNFVGWGIYRNNHELDFNTVQTGTIITNFPAYCGASSVWADFNGDGYDDLLTSDGTESSGRTRIFLNDGAGHLTNSNIVLPALTYSSVAAGDIFNHGRNDIVITGRTPGDPFNPQIMVLRNDGNGVFTPVDFGFYPTCSKTGLGIALADYDNDGRLDIAVIGGGLTFMTIDSTSVYRNEMAIPTNHPPTAPGGLSTVVGAGTVTFTWGSATDDITPANLLTYNLRVGTNSLGTQTVSPLANEITGWRKIPAPGNCGHCFSTLYRFPPGTYYWSVQAIDGIFAGGAWATEQTFTITQPEHPLAYIARAASQNTVAWPARFPDYTLQQNSSLTTTNWTVVTNSPFFTYGKLTVNVTNAPAKGFFRLSKP